MWSAFRLSRPLRSVLSKEWLNRARELAWVATGQGVAFLGGFAAIKILTDRLGPEGYGELAFGLTLAGLLHMILYGPVEQTVLRFASDYQKSGRLGLLGVGLRSLHLRLAILLILSGGLVALAVAVRVGPEWAVLVGLGIVFGITNGANASVTSLLNGLRERSIVALHQAADPWLRLGLALVAVRILGETGYGAMLGFAAGAAILTLSQGAAAARARPMLRGTPERTFQGGVLRQQLLMYGGPFVIFSLLAALSAYSDRWLLLANLGVGAVGIYAAIYQIANAPILLFTGIVNQLFVPIIFERARSSKDSSDSSRLIHIVVALYLSSMGVFAGIAYLFSERIVRFLTTTTFADSAGLLWILVLALALANVGQLLVLKGLSRGESRIYIASKAVQTASFLLAAVPLMNWMGIEGVAWALCLSSASYMLSVMLVNRRLTLAQ